MKTTLYPEDTSQITGTFFELHNEEYLQVERDNEGAVALWSSTATLEQTIAAFKQVLGSASVKESGTVILKTGHIIEPSSAQAEDLAQDNPKLIKDFIAGYGPTSKLVSWRHERVKLIGGIRPLAEIGISGAEVDTSDLFALIALTATSSVREAFRTDSTTLLAALGEKAINPAALHDRPIQ